MHKTMELYVVGCFCTYVMMGVSSFFNKKKTKNENMKSMMMVSLPSSPY